MPKISAKEIAASEITGTALAAVFGLSLRRVQQLAADGTIPRDGDLFRLGEAVQAYVKWIKASQERSKPSEARERLLLARATQIEMANRERSHALIDTEEALAAVDEVVGAYRTELGGLPARLTRDLDRRDEITKEIDGLLGRVSTLFTKRAAELRADGALSVPVEEVEE